MSSARFWPVPITAKTAALEEGEGEREGDVVVGREAREVGGRVEAGGVDRQQDQREQRRGDDLGRLAHGADDRAPGQLLDLERRAGLRAATRAGSRRRSLEHGLLAGPRLLRLGLGALERAAGLGEEDVVEAGGVQLDVGDPDALVVEGADDGGELLGAVVEADRGAVGRAGDELAEAVEECRRRGRARAGRRGRPRRSGGRPPP